MAATEAQVTGRGTRARPGQGGADLIRRIRQLGPSVHSPRFHGTLNVGEHKPELESEMDERQFCPVVREMGEWSMPARL